MEISVPIDVSVLDYSGIGSVEYPVYNKNVKAVYDPGALWESGNIIYKYNGDTSLTPPDYDVGDEAGYVLNDVLFKDNATVKVTGETGGTIAKQPDEYSSTTISKNLSVMTGRYSKIHNYSADGFTEVHFGDNVYHSLNRSSESGTGWKYKIRYFGTEYSWSTSRYSPIDPPTLFVYYKQSSSFNPGKLRALWDNDLVYNTSKTESQVYEGLIVTGTDGLQYKVGRIRQTETDYTYWEISQAQPYEGEIVFEQDCIVSNTLVVGDNEPNPIIKSSTPNYKWLGSYLCINQSGIYLRTNSTEAEQTKTLSNAEFQTIEDLNMFPLFSPHEATQPTAPFDGKNYTYLMQEGPVYYEIQPSSKFNSIAIAAMRATNIKVVFYDDTGSEVSRVDNYVPDMSRDMDGRLPAYNTTAIIYAKEDIPARGTIQITFEGNEVRIGTILVGLSTNAGFTNPIFQNEYIDRSPYEQDQWGNVVYVEGVKQNIHRGTVEVPIKRYDQTHRLMTSLGSKTVIIDGSDNTLNKSPNSETIFSSTMLIGRIKKYGLQTNLKGKNIDDLAVFSFTIEEQV